MTLTLSSSEHLEQSPLTVEMRPRKAKWGTSALQVTRLSTLPIPILNNPQEAKELADQNRQQLVEQCQLGLAPPLDLRLALEPPLEPQLSGSGGIDQLRSP